MLSPLQNLQHEDPLRNIETHQVNQEGVDLLVARKTVPVGQFDRPQVSEERTDLKRINRNHCIEVNRAIV